MKKQVFGILAALFAFVVLLPVGARAANTAYAILYNDGTLVFQNGDAPESGRAVTKTYAVDLTAVYNGYDSNYAPWYNERESVRVASFADKISPTSTAGWFFPCGNLERVDNIQNLDTSHVTDMSWMFSDCEKLTELDVSDFDTSNVTTMYAMFYKCSSLTKLDVSGFKTSNVTDMQFMFGDCAGLSTLDVSGFDTANVTQMHSMFIGCKGLKTLNVSGFKTSNVTDMSWTFNHCESLTTLDVSRFDTSKVTNMHSMFDGCGRLATLDVSHFDTANVIDMSWMFYGCSSLKTIYASEKFTSKSVLETEDYNSNNMFGNCAALIGVNGTKYDSGHTDKEYARIDTASAPGYFTEKTETPVPGNAFDVTRDAYPFGNGMPDFGYASRGGKGGGAYPISPQSLFTIFGESVRSKMLYLKMASAPWAGNCAGMSASAALLFAYGQLNPADFGKSNAYSLAIGDKNAEMSVLTLVEAMQTAQYTDAFGRARQANQVLSGQSLNSLYQAVKADIEKGFPTLIAIVKEKVGGHALLAVGADDAGNRILIYDCNHPGELRYMTLSDNNTVWRYDMGGYGVWGGGDAACSISYVPYATLEDIWANRGKLNQTSQALTVNAENASITNFDGDTVATLENGRLVTGAEGVYELVDLSMHWPEERSVCLPRNEVYTISTSDDITLNASMTDLHMSAAITTSANSVTFGVNDDEKENSVVIAGASASDTYSISLESDFDGLRHKSVTMTGTGKGQDVTVSMNQDDGINLVNCNISSLSVDGQSKVYGVADATPDGGKLVVTLTNPGAATLAAAYFDGDGKFVSAALQGVEKDADTVTLSIPANAKTARVMLLDNHQDCRPLCAAHEATL